MVVFLGGRGQQGSVLVVSMLILLALLSIAGLSALQVKGSVQSSGNERFRKISLMAAESGVEAVMHTLRDTYERPGMTNNENGQNTVGIGYWSSIVSANNSAPFMGIDVPGNRKKPGDAYNLFDPKLQAWFDVRILNNERDPGFAEGNDRDAIVVVESTGYGPNKTKTRLRLELRSPAADAEGRPCPTYAQRGMAADNAGYNACLGTIDLDMICKINPTTGLGEGVTGAFKDVQYDSSNPAHAAHPCALD